MKEDEKETKRYVPSPADFAFEELWVAWAEGEGIPVEAAKWLALYQYAGGNAFMLKDIEGKFHYAPRPVC